MPRQVDLGSVDHLPERDGLLLKAVHQRDLAAVQQQLAAGADLSARCDIGLTALHVAAEAADRDVVAALLDAGADVEAEIESDEENIDGCTTLVAALLQAGADPGSSSQEVEELLHAAASSGREEVVQQVLGALSSSRAVLLGAPGVLPAAATKALHEAAMWGYREVAEALVAAGADLEHQHIPGCTSLQVALASGHCHLVPLLVTPGNVNLLYGPERYDKGVPGRTALHQAVRYPDTLQVAMCYAEEEPWVAATQQAVAALLAAGADISVKDTSERTPLAVAAADGHPEVLPVLLKHVLQQYKAEQQQQKEVPTPLLQQRRQHQQRQQQQQVPPPQQQQEGRYMQMMQEAGALALARGSNTWQVLLPLVAEALWEEGVRRLWAGAKHQLQHMELPSGEEGGGRLRIVGPYTPPRILTIVMKCWAAAWGGLAAQRSGITERLQQLVVHPQHHQQQQASKRPRLTRELRSLTKGTPAAAAAAAVRCYAGAYSVIRSKRAARAQVRHLVSELSHLTQVEAAAARGDEPGMRAAVRQLPSRIDGLSIAAAAAAGAGHWELCMGLLRELVMLGQVPKANPPTLLYGASDKHLPTIGHRLQIDLDTALLGCDALLADWLALRQQRVRELQVVVVAAAEAGVSAAPCL